MHADASPPLLRDIHTRIHADSQDRERKGDGGHFPHHGDTKIDRSIANAQEKQKRLAFPAVGRPLVTVGESPKRRGQGEQREKKQETFVHRGNFFPPLSPCWCVRVSCDGEAGEERKRRKSFPPCHRETDSRT